jgi:hypothetical protein
MNLYGINEQEIELNIASKKKTLVAVFEAENHHTKTFLL